MKKKLEAELISIAHRILKLTNKSDINQLYLETQKLYEKLAVLKFVDDNFDGAKPTIGRAAIVSQIEEAFTNETIALQASTMEAPLAAETIILEETTASNDAAVLQTSIHNEPIVEDQIAEEPLAEEISTEEAIVAEVMAEEVHYESTIDEELIAEEPEVLVSEIYQEEEAKTAASEYNDDAISLLNDEEKKAIERVTETSFSDFTPAFELDNEDEEDEEIAIIEEPKRNKPSEAVQISFEDLMGINYVETQFVKVDDVSFVSAPKITEFKEKKEEQEVAVLEKAEPKAMSLNDRLSKGIHIDLNDRLAFTKHLFGNSPEDYNRVLNQLITFDTFGETRQFIEDMVKPDYNNWDGKDDYAHRFMEILEKKFL